MRPPSITVNLAVCNECVEKDAELNTLHRYIDRLEALIKCTLACGVAGCPEKAVVIIEMKNSDGKPRLTAACGRHRAQLEHATTRKTR